MWDKPHLQLAFWALGQDGTLGQMQRNERCQSFALVVTYSHLWVRLIDDTVLPIIGQVYFSKNLINRDLHWIRVEIGSRNSHPTVTAKPNRKKKTPFLATTQAMKSHRLFVYYSPSWFSFPLHKSSPFLALQGLACACHGHRPRNYSSLLILNKSILLEK